ncbi:MAG: hypothetical protein GY786_11160 [Proteobacteria bacterium]|nr:hypothetical protein [Pseudomonadota bacterium]
MYNIRQVYLDYVGFKGAWFQDVYLPFQNSPTQNKVGSVDTILSLTNGGGKTTLLSLIFTCFVPNKRLFVQHLQKTHHHFNDYFTEKPGLILIELECLSDQLRIDGTQGFEKIIIGQYISIDPSTNEDDRQFFAFKPSDTLSFDDVPSLGNGKVASKDEIRKWLKNVSEQEETFFRPHNNSHAEWMKWLDSEGIDTWIIRKQVEFCRAEGGIDAYMNFQSELDFLKEFYYMVMPPGNAEQNREILSQALIKLQKRPEYERKKQLLVGLKSRMSPFAADASLMSLKEKELQINQNTAAAIYQGMSGRVEELSTLIKVQKDQIKENSLQSSGLEMELKRENAELEEITDSLFQIQLHDKRKALEGQDEKRKLNLQLEKEIQAALSLSHKQDLEHSLNSYQETIDNASLDLEPIKEAKDQAALNFFAKLKNLQEKQEHAKSQLETEEKEIQSKLNQTKEILLNNNRDHNRFSIKLGEIIKSLDQRNHHQKQLIDESLLQPEQIVSDKLVELVSEIDLNQGSYQKNREQLKVNHEEVEVSSKNLEASIQEQSELKYEINKLEDDRVKASAAKEQLIKEPLLYQIIGDEVLDPAEKNIELQLVSYLSRKETEEQDKLVARQLIREELILLEETHSSLLDKNTYLALKHLQDNGVGGAFFYPDLFANQYKMSPKLIQEWVESDLGRFRGIGIPETQDWAEVKKLNLSMDFLRYPIKITKLVAEENFKESPIKDLSDGEEWIISPVDQKIYNKKGVEEKVKKLQKKEKILEKELIALSELRNRIQWLIQRQQDYSQDYGSNQLEILIQTTEFAKENLQTKNTKVQELRERKIKSQDAIVQIESEQETLK